MPATYYPAVIDRSASGFGVSFPDFPGCVAAGATPSEAAVQAEAALALHLAALVKDGDDIPEPSDLADIEPVEEADDVARILVRADTPVKVARVLVSIDEALLRAIDAVAANRSAFLAEAAREKIDRRVTRVALDADGSGTGSAFDDLIRELSAAILGSIRHRPTKPAAG